MYCRYYSVRMKHIPQILLQCKKGIGLFFVIWVSPFQLFDVKSGLL